jgi:hypothetical protein
MKKRKLNSLSLKKQVVSSLNQSIVGGADSPSQIFTVSCARPIGNCTIALTVQPLVCELYSKLYGCDTLVKC